MPAEARLLPHRPSSRAGGSPHDGPIGAPRVVSAWAGEGPVHEEPVDVDGATLIVAERRLRLVGPDGVERWSRIEESAGPALYEDQQLAVALAAGGVQQLSASRGEVKRSLEGGAAAIGGPLLLNGELAWVDEAGGRPTGLCADEERIFVALADGHLAATAPRGRLWTSPLPGAPVGHPITDGGVVYVAWRDGSGGGLSAFGAHDGEKLWTGLLAAAPSTPPTLGEALYLGLRGGAVAAISTDGGILRWTAELGAEVSARPAVSRTGLYVGDGDGRLHRLDKDDGGLIFTVELPAPVAATPLLRPGALQVALTDGQLLTLREGR